MDAVSPVSRFVSSFRDTRRLYLVSALMVLNALDVVLTQIGLDRGAIEQNVLMAGPVAGGYLSAALAKLACLTIGLLAVGLAPRGSRLIDGGLAFCVCWYAAVVCWNLSVIAAQA